MWIFVLIFLSNLSAREYKDDRIAANYYEGETLVYDCKEGHWVCAAQSSVDLCQKNRGKSEEREQKSWPCVVFNKYSTTEQCHKFVEILVNDPSSKTFCHRSDFRHELTQY